MKKSILLKNARSLGREAQRSINGGAGSRIICCEYNDQGKCVLWIGPGQNCP
ncbi:hypothetical protein [Chryseobacterium sp. SIMBA_029]|uniref:hypothetical protein n=1 Tax=Chryseobacterium sp. SIMBA_029 TaxID=3085772 RepID=UPI003978C0D3